MGRFEKKESSNVKFLLNTFVLDSRCIVYSLLQKQTDLKERAAKSFDGHLVHRTKTHEASSYSSISTNTVNLYWCMDISPQFNASIRLDSVSGPLKSDYQLTPTYPYSPNRVAVTLIT